MRLSELVCTPVYQIDINQVQDEPEKIISDMQTLSLFEIPVLSQGRWAGIFRFLSKDSDTNGEKHGAYVMNAPSFYEDMELKDIPIPRNCTILGVVNRQEEFTGIVHIADIQTIFIKEYETTRERIRFLDAIIDNTYDGILIVDSLGYVTRVNQGFCRLTGVKEEDFVGVHVTDLVQKGTFKFPSVTWSALQKRRDITGIQKYPTGHEHLVSAVPIIDNQGKLHGAVASVRDMTELSRLRQELEAVQDLSQHYKSELTDLRKRVLFDQIIAVSGQMQKVMDLAGRVANFDSTVLILGESGVGKEVIANFIHKSSSRVQGPFVKINCGALPEELLESELFGYEAGAFTGAKKGGKIGLFQAAEGGVIFLDEIGEMSPALQVKVLRVLQEQEFTRVGGISPIQVNCRVIAATHRDLKEQIKKGQFREDLFYRLYVVPIHIPPLRERQEDIPALLQYFLNKYNQKYGTQKTLQPEVIQILKNYSWHGNVRQLSNLVERMIVTIPDSYIQQMHLPEDYIQDISAADHSVHSERQATNTAASNPEPTISEREPKENMNAFGAMERDLLIRTLTQHGSVRKAGQALGVSHTTIIKKMRKYGIERNR
ncbi:sigma 54-interacting transcriptional regulator [Fodinisporobacter ferrooxydans]|uniref:HTH-type transcriptional regulatory protein TyrR n=1 Tax=Fodinisporobacter ferrooxydans TaxID=2901836 RepID=A0ABY4CQ69_9BACL|nr:sigma 54-interacting transcriptional regulator [Alicyclobacillaceae bacterium MYW30-H2]